MAQLLISLFLLLVILPCREATKWELLQSSIGISAMHMQLLHTDHVVIFDWTKIPISNISLPYEKCHNDPNNTTSTMKDCFAHSVEYNIVSNSVRPLMVQTDVWCSSGAVMPDGALVQTGGDGMGQNVVRVFKPCSNDSCDWYEINGGLINKRWYATNQILPDGREIIVGGRDEPNYEFFPKVSSSGESYDLSFFSETNDPGVQNNLYPFVFLNGDGNLFIFANNRAILYDYNNKVVVRTYPEIPGGDPRNYPSTGSAVLLPFKDNNDAEVLVCGGAPKGSFLDAQNNGKFRGALNTCGRIKINDKNPEWVMETMPMGRVMGDMILLPNGNVLIINGAGSGTAAWYLGRDPVFSPVLYKPNNPIGSRFEVQPPSSMSRMYHSAAILVRDGRVLVGGSNPNEGYNFTGVLFPTDLSLEAFSPSYLDPDVAYLRPKIVSPISQSKIGYSQQLSILFTLPQVNFNITALKVTMVAPSFNTHSFSMNQRLLILHGLDLKVIGTSSYSIQVETPDSRNNAPPGYYLLFVVYEDIPSEGIWVQIN